MKTITICIATLLCAALLASTAYAATDVKALWSISEEGPLAFTLPQDATVVPGKAYDAYVISWPAQEDVHAYDVGVTQEIDGFSGHTYFNMAEGYLHEGTVQDGQGNEHFVQNVIFDSLVLRGGATEADIAPILNAFHSFGAEETGEDVVPLSGGVPVAYHVIVLTIPVSGAPVKQLITLPAS